MVSVLFVYNRRKSKNCFYFKFLKKAEKTIAQFTNGN